MVSLTLDKERTQSLYAAGADSMNIIEKIADNMGIRFTVEHMEGASQSKDEGIQHIVITSYSIHYTKLYERTILD